MLKFPGRASLALYILIARARFAQPLHIQRFLVRVSPALSIHYYSFLGAFRAPYTHFSGALRAPYAHAKNQTKIRPGGQGRAGGAGRAEPLTPTPAWPCQSCLK